MGPYLPRILFDVGLANKGCNRTYNKLMVYNSNIIIEVKNKWERVLNEEEIRRRRISCQINVTRDNVSRDLG